jgi:hypothetical protein
MTSRSVQPVAALRWEIAFRYRPGCHRQFRCDVVELTSDLRARKGSGPRSISRRPTGRHSRDSRAWLASQLEVGIAVVGPAPSGMPPVEPTDHAAAPKTGLWARLSNRGFLVASRRDSWTLPARPITTHCQDAFLVDRREMAGAALATASARIPINRDTLYPAAAAQSVAESAWISEAVRGPRTMN